jgi:hypothetical protein
MISLARSRPARAAAGLGEQVRGVDGGRGERGEGTEQRDLFPLEDPRPPVRREQHPDDTVPEHQRHTEDRHQPLVPHPGVDGERCAGTGRP